MPLDASLPLADGDRSDVPKDCSCGIRVHDLDDDDIDRQPFDGGGLGLHRNSPKLLTTLGLYQISGVGPRLLSVIVGFVDRMAIETLTVPASVRAVKGPPRPTRRPEAEHGEDGAQRTLE
jgi:hypothetical protein